MEITEASTHLANILEVDDTQYSPDSRLAHLNQAAMLMSRRYETRLNFGLADLEIDAGDKKFLLSRLNDSLYIAEAVIGNMWFNPTSTSGEYTNYPIMGGTITELLNEWGDTEAPVVEGYAQHDQDVHIRPVPSQDCVIRVNFTKVPIFISAGTNSWFTHVPWAIIYKAGEIGCTHVGQGSRISEFRSLRQEEMETFNIADSSRFDMPMTAEDPG